MAEPKLKGLRNAWLSPAGKIITWHKLMPLEWAAYHENLGWAIIAEQKGFPSYLEAFEWLKNENYLTGATEYLEDRGWIRLHALGETFLARFIIPCDHRLTKRQEAAIVDWCNANERTYTSAFAD